jgi:hypoxanthine phosphoribosyltransferase
MTTPSQYKVLFSKEEIAREVARIGADISAWCEAAWKDSNVDVLAIPILRGGIFLFADLVREITHSVQIAPAQSWAYRPGENATQLASVRVDLNAVPAKGRRVLIIDDICDSGRTLKTLSDALYSMGAVEVRTAVLITREVVNQEHTPNWSCFSYSGAEWIVGYGMEDAERWRNLPFVGIISSK